MLLLIVDVLSELGRFPLYFNIIKCMLLYWYRLENLGREFPLLKEAYNETKLLYFSKKPTWFGEHLDIYPIISVIYVRMYAVL
jgi:hypothetical protein